MLSDIRKQIAVLLAKASGASEEDALSSLELPKTAFGDIASTIAFSLAKKRKEDPRRIAEEIAAKVEKHKWIGKAEAAGPYINFFFSDEFYADGMKKVTAEGENFGRGEKKGKALVEFPSVNPNKPWHIGHLRNALLGDSVSNILAFSGYNVERLDYIDDLGLQVAQSLWGYIHGAEEADKKFDHWLGEKYVEVAEKIEKKMVESEVRELLKELEKGEGNIAEKGREMVERCVHAQYETAFSYGIYHDGMIFESDISRAILKKGLEQLSKSDAIVVEKDGENKGCLVAKMEGKEFEGLKSADKVLIRSDGTAVYTGKDVVFQLWKFGKVPGRLCFKPFVTQPNGKVCYATWKEGKEMDFGKGDIVINVIGVEQTYPQKVIAEILRLMGLGKEAKNSIHLAYEHAWLPGAKFSGRMGTWIGYTSDELLKEGVKRAMERVKAETSDEEKEKIARSVGAGAIRFSFLKIAPEKKITFKWDEALSLEGDSAPYLQYAHARACAVLEKAKEAQAPRKGKEAYSFTTEEKALLSLAFQFPDIVERAGRDYKPHYIADYLLDLAAAFNRFYATSPILAPENDEATREARLGVLKAAKVSLSNGLALLGIEAIEKM